MKKMRFGLMAAVVAALLTLSSAYAGHGDGGCGKRDGCGGDGFGQKFFMKAHFILEHAQELGLTQAKVDEIHRWKMEAKKKLIKQQAEIDVLALDIKSKLMQTPMDADGIKGLLDQKYDLLKAQSKESVDALAKLKNSLTPEQHAKLKALWQAEDAKGGKQECGFRGKR